MDCTQWNQVEGFDEIIAKADKNDINVGWSNPCIEIWFFSYFGRIPSCIDSTVCCEKFKDKFQWITKSVYKKSDIEIYNRLNQFGSEEKAIETADWKYRTQISNGILKPSEMNSTTTLFQLVGEIREKIFNNEREE